MKHHISMIYKKYRIYFPNWNCLRVNKHCEQLKSRLSVQTSEISSNPMGSSFIIEKAGLKNMTERNSLRGKQKFWNPVKILEAWLTFLNRTVMFKARLLYDRSGRCTEAWSYWLCIDSKEVRGDSRDEEKKLTVAESDGDASKRLRSKRCFFTLLLNIICPLLFL